MDLAGELRTAGTVDVAAVEQLIEIYFNDLQKQNRRQPVLTSYRRICSRPSNGLRQVSAWRGAGREKRSCNGSRCWIISSTWQPILSRPGICSEAKAWHSSASSTRKDWEHEAANVRHQSSGEERETSTTTGLFAGKTAMWFVESGFIAAASLKTRKTPSASTFTGCSS